MYQYSYKTVVGKKITDKKIVGGIDKYLIVSDGDKKGVIDYAGNIILPIMYSKIKSYDMGNFIVEIENKYGVVDCNNNSVIDMEYSYIVYIGHNLYKCENNCKFFIFNNEGKKIEFSICPKYVNFTNDYIIITDGVNTKFFDKDYNEVKFIKGSFKSDFVNNKAIVLYAKGHFENIRWYDKLIDNTGNTLFKKKYKDLKILNNKFFAIDKFDKIVIIDTKGRVIDRINQKATRLYDFHNGLAIFNYYNDYGIINENGKIIEECSYEFIKRVGNLYDLYDGFAHKIINKSGKLVHIVLGKFDNITELKQLSNGEYLCDTSKFTYILKDNGIKKEFYKKNSNIYDVGDNYIIKEDNNAILVDKDMNLIVKKYGNIDVKKQGSFLLWNYNLEEKNEYELTDSLGNVIIKRGITNILVIDDSKVIVDNRLVDFSSEFLKFNYQLNITYKNFNYNYIFKSERERKRYRLYFEKFLRPEIDRLESKYIEDTNNFINKKYYKVLKKGM